MKILEIYILKRVFQMFLTALLPVLAIIWTTQVLQQIDLVTDTGQSIGSFIKLATLILPNIVPTVAPFALVIGISQVLTTMNNESELAVIDAAGASRGIVYKPVLIIAIGVSLVSFVLSGFTAPHMRVAARELVAAAYADLLSTVIEEKSFRRVEPGLYVQISKRHSGRILEGLFVADYRNPQFDLIYYAREGAVDQKGGALVMQDGEVHRKTKGGEVSVVRFDSYSFDLSDFSKNQGKAWYTAGDRDLPFLLSPDPNDADVQKVPGEYRAELHQRLTGWIQPVVLALMTLVFAGDARSHRETRLNPMGLSLVIALMLFWLSNYVATLITANASYVPLAYALPAVTGGLSAFFLFRGRALRMPATIRNRSDGLLRTIEKYSGENGQES